jgi:Sulfatase
MKPKTLALSIRENWNDPFWFRNTIVRKLVLPVLFSGNRGDYVLDERWDNLIILDACRYDTFSRAYQAHGLKGRLESRVSRGTETNSFLRENFGGRKITGDLVYITANPTVTQGFSPRFHKVISVWKDEWDSKYQTVLPERMYERTLQAMAEFPNKRLIIHFLQPHRPFVGYPYPNWWRFKKPGAKYLHIWGDFNERGRSWLGQVDKATLMALYRNNLAMVLPYVKRLQDDLPGLTVITSDHGEAFGDWLHPLVPFRVYGHPSRTRIKALIKVPWLVAESERKKDVTPAPQTVPTEVLSDQDEKLIEDRLSALGYV